MASPLQATDLWSRVEANPVSPPNGFLAAAAYDDRRREMVHFSAYWGPANPFALTLSLAPEWRAIVPTGAPPTAILGQSMVYDSARDRMLLFGGRLPSGQPTNELFALSRGLRPTWTRLLPTGSLPPRRESHTAVYDAAGRRMVVFGGDSLGVALGDVWALPVDGAPVWQRIVPAGASPGARTRAAAAYDPVRQRLWLFGGRMSGVDQDDVWSLSLDGAPTWAELPTQGVGPDARHYHSALYDEARDRLIVCGGLASGAPRSDVWALDLATATWELLSSGSPIVGTRYGHAATYDPGGARMVVFGGGNSEERETWSFSLLPGGDWTPLVLSLPPHGRAASVFDPIHRQMILFGGRSDKGGDLGGTWVLPLGVPAIGWQRLFPGGTVPGARISPVAVWDSARERMLLFGGSGFGAAPNELWAYTPDPPGWSQVATQGTLPGAGRVEAGLVYDAPRDRLVLFGGNNSDATAYELPLSGPGALTWSPLPTSGTPPGARHGHAMVRDPVRHRAIVMGGMRDPNPENPPTVYDDLHVLSLEEDPPAWSEWVLASRPPMRFWHAAAYDPAGDRMLVFGGFLTSGLFPPPVLYDDLHALSLASPAWTEVQPPGARPAARFLPAAVMDPFEARLVVCGGALPGPDAWNDTWILGGPPTTSVEPPAPVSAPPAIEHASFDRALRQLRVMCVIAGQAPATVAVFDLAGRRLASRELSAAGPSRTEVRFDAAGLHAGLYFLRIEQSGLRAHSKVTVLP